MPEASPHGAHWLSPNALRVLEARYLRREPSGASETPDALIRRVARAVALAETTFDPAGAAAWEERFAALLGSLAFLPNSPTLMNAGTPLGQLSACFVLPVEDAIESIFEAVKQMALVQRTGGGTGFSFSRLRPKGDRVASTGGEASGPVSFMRIFDAATENIKQGGKRRGANMGVLRVDHPDLDEFIRAKLDSRALRNFNLSVGATDAFMDAVVHAGQYDVVHPRTGRVVARRPARPAFDRIVHAAWTSGDPGLLFLDPINRAHPTPALGAIEATNPCGEIPLLPYEACTLGSINLARMLATAGGAARVDWERLRATTTLALRFLDDVIEVNRYPIPEIAQMARANRKIGLGVMGFAEMLIRLGLPYDSDPAAALGEELMRVIADQALAASRALADERGAFANWERSIYAGRGPRLRNATRTAVAPTGTLSILADTTAGIEPLFALAYRHTQVLGGQTLVEANPLFARALAERGLDVGRVLAAVLATGRVQDADPVPAELRRLFVTALEIPVERHLRIQAAFQMHVDNAVSKTINLPEPATPEDVARTYLEAWRLGLKGITIYRYGSKSEQVLVLGAGEASYQYDHAIQCDPDECRV